MTQRVLVTGATGFLGGYLVNELIQNGYEVVAFGRNRTRGLELDKLKGVSFFCGDLRKSEDIENALRGCDAVVHAAAKSDLWGDQKDFFDTNVFGTQRLIRACESKGVKRVIFVSSPSIYTKPKNQLDVTEDQAPLSNTLNYYIESKILAERAFKRSSLGWTIVRPRGLFGPGDTSIIPRLIAANEKGFPLPKEGDVMTDVTCVENVAYAIRLMLENPLAVLQTYNITNGEPMSTRDLAELLFLELDMVPNFKIMPRWAIVQAGAAMEATSKLLKSKTAPILTKYSSCLLAHDLTLNIDQARNDLGYKPKLSIAEGIRRYGDWYRVKENPTHED